MNKAKLKSYAPQARKDFIAAVTARANLLGLSEKAGKLEVAISQPQGDATLIAGQAWPVKVHSQRQQLITRIQKDGFSQTMEAVAYTWFNRFAALRYMELHDYLGHGHRALSSLEGALPDILTHAADLAQIGAGEGGLPGLKPALVIEMKLAGNRDGELYSMLLVAQCNALSNVMPFLFERIDDETELLLPDNLLRTDSVIAKLVASIEEDDWKEVEIIGWLYQFYISEKKDEVIGKVVKSEDIPAATQLFTPNWIVQYLVQNSVGRLWLMANPASTLKAQWPYYIAPADQTPEVQAQLDALIQTRVDEDGDSLNPESITLLDPACGSGHILVEAYEVLKAIYLERGYQPRSIPRLILEKNLYGLDIDDRAAQMAGFALLMKARADDRRIFNEPIKFNVLALQESKGLDGDVLTCALQTVSGRSIPQIEASATIGGTDDLFPGTRWQSSVGESFAADTAGEPLRAAIAAIITTFAHAKTFGSLIQIPQTLNAQLAVIKERLELALQNGDLYAKAAAQDLWPLVAQAQVLGMQFDAVVANPPYMGGKGMNPVLKGFARTYFPEGKSDLFAMFMERGFDLCKRAGFNAMVSMQAWMFQSSLTKFRQKILNEKTIENLIHIGYNSFPELNSKIAQACAFSIRNVVDGGFVAQYIDLTNNIPHSADKKSVFDKLGYCAYQKPQSDFNEIPDSPIAYWASTSVLNAFKKWPTLGNSFSARTGMTTGDDGRFIRLWHEVPYTKIGNLLENKEQVKSSGMKWFPYNKGGVGHRWYGHCNYVVNWGNDGEEVKHWVVNNPNDPDTTSWSRRVFNHEYFFKPGITWTLINITFNVRLLQPGNVLNVNGPTITCTSERHRLYLLGYLNSSVALRFMNLLSPTLTNNPGEVEKLPWIDSEEHQVVNLAKRLIEIHEAAWNEKETSSAFAISHWLTRSLKAASLSRIFSDFLSVRTLRFREIISCEGEINDFFSKLFSIEPDSNPVAMSEPADMSEGARETDCQLLISYAIGCMMGRYSLDEPGLIYANAGNVDFDDSRYASFPADADGIVPLTDELWFEDEAASRIREFLLTVWGADTLVENMAWLAESLGTKAGETPDETIRRYLADKFYKDHLQTYKKRPIYWLFSSGKQGAFQALVYLHRYHEGTLARMRAEYVVPLTGKIQARIDMLEKDAAAAASTAARNKLAKEVEKLKKKHVELLAYDEQLRHHADMRITLDLDDGVKVNYGKFGNLLAEVRAVTGGASDD